MNDENLIPNSERTPSELREITSKGGIKSGESRRKKKKMREVLGYFLHEAELPEHLREDLEEHGISEEDMNHLAVMTKALVSKAESGDVSAYNTIATMMGEKPKEEMDVDMRMKIEYIDSNQELAHSEEEVE